MVPRYLVRGNSHGSLPNSTRTRSDSSGICSGKQNAKSSVAASRRTQDPTHQLPYSLQTRMCNEFRLTRSRYRSIDKPMSFMRKSLLDPLVHPIMHVARTCVLVRPSVVKEPVTCAVGTSDDGDGDRLAVLELVEQSFQAEIRACSSLRQGEVRRHFTGSGQNADTYLHSRPIERCCVHCCPRYLHISPDVLRPVDVS